MEDWKQQILEHYKTSCFMKNTYNKVQKIVLQLIEDKDTNIKTGNNSSIRVEGVLDGHEMVIKAGAIAWVREECILSEIKYSVWIDGKEIFEDAISGHEHVDIKHYWDLLNKCQRAEIEAPTKADQIKFWDSL